MAFHVSYSCMLVTCAIMIYLQFFCHMSKCNSVYVQRCMMLHHVVCGSSGNAFSVLAGD